MKWYTYTCTYVSVNMCNTRSRFYIFNKRHIHYNFTFIFYQCWTSFTYLSSIFVYLFDLLLFFADPQIALTIYHSVMESFEKFCTNVLKSFYLNPSLAQFPVVVSTSFLFFNRNFTIVTFQLFKIQTLLFTIIIHDWLYIMIV